MALELSAHCYADGCGTENMDTPLSNTSWFSDQLSLQNAPATGYLEMDYLLEGSWESLANGSGRTDQVMYLILNVNAQNYNLAIHGARADPWGQADSSGFFFQRNSVRVPYNSPLLGITLRMDATARCESGSNGDCTASMMFGNTGQVGNFRILDSAGNPVPGATILAESGHDYTQEIQAVPEPAVLSLTGLGLTLLCVLRRR